MIHGDRSWTDYYLGDAFLEMAQTIAMMPGDLQIAAPDVSQVMGGTLRTWVDGDAGLVSFP